MRSTKERMEAVEKRARVLKKEKAKKTLSATIALSSCLSLSIILILANVIPTIVNSNINNSDINTGLTASIFSNTEYLSYIIIGFLSFLLGISATILCVLIHKRSKEDDS